MTEATPAAFLPATANPAAAAGAVAAAISSVSEKFPDPPETPSDIVPLPGGLLLDKDMSTERVVSTAQVRELNGEDEEAMARALGSGNPFHFLTVLLERGTVRLGNEPEDTTKALLKRLLIGDRDALIIGIRVATYGNKLTVRNFVCPSCGNKSDVEFELDDDIETETLDNPRDAEFEVKLRKGAVAKVRLPDGNVQTALGESKMNAAQRKTLLLQKCVESVTGADGRERRMIVNPNMALTMGLADRRAIEAEISKREPGPKYTAIKITDVDCGNEVSLAIDLGDLFLA
jgi:hypothetical protein